MEITRDKLWMKVNDYSVTKESFELFHNTHFDLLCTYPQPDQAELSRYYESEDYISHTDANRSLFEKVYHAVKAISIKSKVKLMNLESNQIGTLLDIGAGTGDFLAFAKLKGWDALGIEPNEKARSI